jgi:hypothetical protein
MTWATLSILTHMLESVAKHSLMHTCTRASGQKPRAEVLRTVYLQRAKCASVSVCFSYPSIVCTRCYLTRIRSVNLLFHDPIDSKPECLISVDFTSNRGSWAVSCALRVSLLHPLHLFTFPLHVWTNRQTRYRLQQEMVWPNGDQARRPHVDQDRERAPPKNSSQSKP